MKKRLLFVSLFLISILFISSCAQMAPRSSELKKDNDVIEGVVSCSCSEGGSCLGHMEGWVADCSCCKKDKIIKSTSESSDDSLDGLAIPILCDDGESSWDGTYHTSTGEAECTGNTN